MVDLKNGGYIVFFEQDKPKLANVVRQCFHERLRHDPH